MVRKDEVVSFTDSDRANLTVHKYGQAEIDEKCREYKKKYLKKQAVLMVLLACTVVLAIVGHGQLLELVMDLSTAFFVFLVLLERSYKKKGLHFLHRRHYVEVEVLGKLSEEVVPDTTLSPGAYASSFWPVIGRDEATGYISTFYISEDQYMDASRGDKVQIPIKGDRL